MPAFDKILAAFNTNWFYQTERNRLPMWTSAQDKLHTSERSQHLRMQRLLLLSDQKGQHQNLLTKSLLRVALQARARARVLDPVRTNLL